MKKTLVFITPHLSTGGLPQYLFKAIEAIHTDMNVYCIEWENITGGVFVVQRNRIQQILGKNLITLPTDKHELFNILHTINPDIIHLQEIPELFMPNDIADRLYASDRKYVLIETSHDSSYNVKYKQYLPDKFLMVSDYQSKDYATLGMPCDIVEYPIENKLRTKTREQALQRLGLDPNLKHVINVGLFTPRKNQLEIIQYAKELKYYPIQFHFIGNQADNFKSYWEPLMRDFPSNCKWWGERDDVDAFYEAADLFLFTSRGHDTDKETMPLVIREALSWKVPSLIYNLPVYIGYFDKYDTIEYLAEDTQKNTYRIAEKLLREDTGVDSYFNFQFIGKENKISIDYKKSEAFTAKISVKDIDSNVPIYWTKISFTPGSNYWIIPVPMESFDFENNPSFSGFLIEFYNDSDELLFVKKLHIKEATLKRTIRLDLKNPFDCLFNNYNEMFVARKFDCYGLTNLDVVLDIGANNGLFSLLMLNNGCKKVYAFEPNQQSLINLKHIFKDTKNLITIEKAIHTEDTDIEFFIDPNNTTVGGVSETHLLSEGFSAQKIIVPAISLKTFINENNIDKISLVKMDIEGGEYDIIEKLEDEVYDKIDSFLIEFHNNTDKRVVKLIDTLKRKGYYIEQIRDQNSKNNEDLSLRYDSSKIGTFLAKKSKAPNLVPQNKSKPILIVDAFFHNNHTVNVFKNYLNSVKRLNIPIMLITNSNFDKSLIDELDYIVYDSNNRLSEGNYKDTENIVLYSVNDSQYISMSTSASQKHGLSVLSNLYHSTNLAKNLGYTHFYRIEYDCVLGDTNGIKQIIDVVELNNKRGLVHINDDKYISFQIWYFELEYFTKYFPKINNELDYIAEKKKFNYEKDFMISEEFVYNMVKFSDGGFSNLVVKSPEDMHSDYGNCTWNTITSPNESNRITNGCISTISKITTTTDAIRREMKKPRPDWTVCPEECDINPSSVAFITWNCATDAKNNSVATLTYPDGSIKTINHDIQTTNNYIVDIIELVDGDIHIEILINEHIKKTFTINKDTICNLIDVYQQINSL